jgi:adenylate cyclase
MAKILVVDDEEDLEALIKQKFRQKIRQNEYEFVFAYNGRHALEVLLENQDVDVVLSDINMPEMDGLTLLSRLNEQNVLLKSVIVSAYGDMENIRTAMNRGAFDFVTKPVNFADLEITIDKTINHVKTIREMLQTVKENSILKMYVDENVLSFMGGEKSDNVLVHNEIMQGSVAFIDICEFTTISENEPADKVVQLLNTYFDIMVKEIVAEKGVVDKFIGDAVMATFWGDYNLDRAIDACLAIREKIKVSAYNLSVGSFIPEVSIGINNGDMIWGNIGSATLKRLDYTVIGDTVNIAARLQGCANHSQILISEECYLKVKDSFRCRKVGPLKLRNKRYPIQAYEVLE